MHILTWKQNICIRYHMWGVSSTKKEFFTPKAVTIEKKKSVKLPNEFLCPTVLCTVHSRVCIFVFSFLALGPSNLGP